MTDPSGREAASRRRNLWIAGMTAMMGFMLVIPMGVALLQPERDTLSEGTTDAGASTTVEPAAPLISPLVVRPVISAEGTAPEQCPDVTAGPSTGTLQLCDIAKTGLYTLAPESVQLELTQAESLLSPITRGYYVQVSMTEQSARTFGNFTANQVGKQVAFVRGGMVISAPSINERIDGTALQLSGDLSAEESDQIARLLRDEA